LHEHVRSLKQAMEDLLPRRLGHIYGETFFSPVNPNKVAGETLHRLVVIAGEVAGARAFDFNDARPPIRQLPGGEWGSDRLLQGDDREGG
jgi:hypothetical protein